MDDSILSRLRDKASDLKAAGLNSLYLFGSAARGDATASSDIDLFFETMLDRRLSLLDQAQLQHELSDLLKHRVDLLERSALRPSGRDGHDSGVLTLAPEDRDLGLFELILDLVNHLERRLTPLTRSSFAADRDEINLAAYRLAAIGEATHKLSRTGKQRHPAIPWSAIYGMRNIISHDYGAILPDRV